MGEGIKEVLNQCRGPREKLIPTYSSLGFFILQDSLPKYSQAKKGPEHPRGGVHVSEGPNQGDNELVAAGVTRLLSRV